MHLRVFVSSPGDVEDERTFAQQVIEQELPKDPLLRGKLTCEVVRWDDPAAPVAMPATMTPQEAVNQGLAKPSDCDVVIVVLWSRLGTPLPQDLTRPDGSPYHSGTEWEYEDALSATPPPHVLVYRRKTKVEFDPDDPAFDEKIRQLQLVKEFFERFHNPDGSLKGGVAEFETPQEFRDRLRNDLRAFINRWLAEKKTETTQPHIKAPPPYSDISRALRAGRAIPIIGTGVTRTRRSLETSWDPAEPKFLPSGIELSRFLADESSFPSEDDRDILAEVASYYEAFQTRATLRARLRGILEAPTVDEASIPSLYRLLADIPEPLLIVTTNYDTLLERAFRAVGKNYDLVVYPSDRKDLANAVLWWPHGAAEPGTPPPNELDIDLDTTTVIFKMHGSVFPETDEWDGVVITEMDYVKFLSRVGGESAIPSLFSEPLRDRSLLFIGFSLRDWNYRAVLKSLSRYFARRTFDDDEIQSWTIDEQFSELEIKLWQKRGIYPFEVELDEFVETLKTRLMP